MVQTRHTKSARISVLYFFTIQLLLYSIAISGSENSTSSLSGAEFLKNVIGNLQKPIRKSRPDRPVKTDRIDVVEYIPYDTPNDQIDEINMLTKIPFNANGQNANRPSQADSNKNQVGSFFSQIIPDFLKNEFAESQINAVAQTAPQQFNSAPSDSQAQNVIEALSGEEPSRPPDGTISGYNYFFYPLDAKGLQQLQQQQQQQQNGNNQQQQQQNGQSTDMDATKSEMANKPKVQPLFVAMAGFVGIAVVFLSALMFIPILPVPLLSSKGVLKRAPEELASLTKLVAESIDGKDCSERIACEVGRAMRSMRVGSKPIRMMEIILPPSVAKQLAQIRRSASKKEQCHFIMCRKTEGTLKLVAKLKKNNPHNKTIHDVKEIFNMD